MIKLPKVTPDLDDKLKITLGIVVCFAAAAITFLSLVGLAGTFGNFVSSFLWYALGYGCVLVVFAFGWCAFKLLNLQRNTENNNEGVDFTHLWGIIVLILCLCGYLSLFFGVRTLTDISSGGGFIGYLMYPRLFGSFGRVGGFIMMFFVALYGFFLISKMTFDELGKEISLVIKEPARVWNYAPNFFKAFEDKTDGFSGSEISSTIERKPKRPNPANTGFSNDFDVEEDTSNNSFDLDDEPVIPLKQSKKEVSNDPVNIDLKPVISADSKWNLPSLDNLKTSKSKSEPGDIAGNKVIVKNTLEQFGIKVEMGNEYIGPTVTQYTFKPANGVRLSTIDGLQRDLALALASTSIRIEAPIAGKSLVGIEIPNAVKSQVRLGDIARHPKFQNSKDELPLIVGKDVRGDELIFPLTKMPHLLVAGATGSGKSVWINGLLLSLMTKYSPYELQLVLVDMKRVELKLYEGAPHLLSNVIIEADKAINSLKWTVLEMDKRYTILEKYGKRNIKDYNQFVDSIPDWIDTEEEKPEKMPYIVFVIDELGDLMMLAKSEVEPIIVRLTQMSRAVGIHIVLGTQRPDTNVVTGLIKANVPTRIAFTVASQVDSRVILDSTGAEKLLGQGDGLITSPSYMKPIRFQGPNVEEEEVKRVVKFLKKQAEETEGFSNLDLSVTQTPRTKINVPGMSNKADGDEQDEALLEAKRLVIQYQKASASFLQQMMGIGYPKAAKIINKLEALGIVGPQNGSKPRDVYILPDEEEA